MNQDRSARIESQSPQSFDATAINNMIMNKVRELALSLETETDLGRTREKWNVLSRD